MLVLRPSANDWSAGGLVSSGHKSKRSASTNMGTRSALGTFAEIAPALACRHAAFILHCIWYRHDVPVYAVAAGDSTRSQVRLVEDAPRIEDAGVGSVQPATSVIIGSSACGQNQILIRLPVSVLSFEFLLPTSSLGVPSLR